jgi:hypothetical protein
MQLQREPFRQHLSHHRPHLRRRSRSISSRIDLKTARGHPGWPARHLQRLHGVYVLDQLSQRSRGACESTLGLSRTGHPRSRHTSE